MTENIIFRCEVSTDDESMVHVKTEHAETLDIIDVMIVRAYTAAIDKTTEALKVVSKLGRR